MFLVNFLNDYKSGRIKNAIRHFRNTKSRYVLTLSSEFVEKYKILDFDFAFLILSQCTLPIFFIKNEIRIQNRSFTKSSAKKKTSRYLLNYFYIGNYTYLYFFFFLEKIIPKSQFFSKLSKKSKKPSTPFCDFRSRKKSPHSFPNTVYFVDFVS